MRALEERGALMRRIADHARHSGHDTVATMFEERSHKVEDDVKAIHEVIVTGRSLETVGEEV